MAVVHKHGTMHVNCVYVATLLTSLKANTVASKHSFAQLFIEHFLLVSLYNSAYVVFET